MTLFLSQKSRWLQLRRPCQKIRLGIGREDELATGNTVYVVIVDNPCDLRFREADYKEIKVLLDRGTYVVVNESEVPPGATVLRSRVIPFYEIR